MGARPVNLAAVMEGCGQRGAASVRCSPTARARGYCDYISILYKQLKVVKINKTATAMENVNGDGKQLRLMEMENGPGK